MIGVDSVWGTAAGTSVTTNTNTSRADIRIFIMVSSWTRWQAARRAARLKGRSSSLTRRFADGEGDGVLLVDNLLSMGLRLLHRPVVGRQYSVTLSLST